MDLATVNNIVLIVGVIGACSLFVDILSIPKENIVSIYKKIPNFGVRNSLKNVKNSFSINDIPKNPHDLVYYLDELRSTAPYYRKRIFLKVKNNKLKIRFGLTLVTILIILFSGVHMLINNFYGYEEKEFSGIKVDIPKNNNFEDNIFVDQRDSINGRQIRVYTGYKNINEQIIELRKRSDINEDTFISDLPLNSMSWTSNKGYNIILVVNKDFSKAMMITSTNQDEAKTMANSIVDKNEDEFKTYIITEEEAIKNATNSSTVDPNAVAILSKKGQIPIYEVSVNDSIYFVDAVNGTIYEVHISEKKARSIANNVVNGGIPWDVSITSDSFLGFSMYKFSWHGNRIYVDKINGTAYDRWGTRLN